MVPMGANAGAPHDVEMQTAIVKASLELLETIETPGKIVTLPYEYHAVIYSCIPITSGTIYPGMN